MMSRLGVWVTITIAGVLYQVAKIALGFPSRWETVIEASYWGAGAMLMHWWSSRPYRP